MESDQRIHVAVRIRPALERERYDTTCARKQDDGRVISMLNEDGGHQSFCYDHAFDENDDQRAVYEEAVLDLVDCALEGSHVTVFTYGQTGSGKTYTILGKMSPEGNLSAESGLFLRVFGDLFDYQKRVAARKQILITLSAVELYVDDVMDLLNSKSKIRLRESSDDMLMPGLVMKEVQDMPQVAKQFLVANSFRSVTATKMNDTSSRSHALFFIDVFQVQNDQLPSVLAALHTDKVVASALLDDNGDCKNIAGVQRSRIALVDLAGSERVKKSGAEGQTLVEAAAINKSLSALGTVINALYLQQPHVPFRTSKLTKVLKTSFMDKSSRLLLVGQIAPATESLSESLGTLRFCDRVKGLKVSHVSQFADPEQEAAYLRTLLLNEELCSDLRIAHCLHQYSPQRPRYCAARANRELQSTIQSLIASLRSSASHREKELEEESLRSARVAAKAEQDAAVRAYEMKVSRVKRELSEVDSAIDHEKNEAKTHKKQLDDKIDDKMTEAKKQKKARLTAEDKIAKLKVTLADMEGQSTSLMRRLSIVISDGSPPSLKRAEGSATNREGDEGSTATNGSNRNAADEPSSSAAVGRPNRSSGSVTTAKGDKRKDSRSSNSHGFDDDEEDEGGEVAAVMPSRQSTTPGVSAVAHGLPQRTTSSGTTSTANAFDIESDDDVQASKPSKPLDRGATAIADGASAVSLVVSSAAAEATDTDEAGWIAFEADWQQSEANHEVVSDFYFHVKSLHPLHMEYVHLLQQNWKRWGEVVKVRFKQSEVLQQSTLIPDIIAFVVERAVLIGDRVIEPTDTYAWLDIDGLSRKLRTPFELYPPLLLDAVREPIPAGQLIIHRETFLEETEDEDADDAANSAALTKANRQQLGLPDSVLAGANATTTKEARERRKKSKTNGPTKKFDTEEADRQYLMTVYDSCTLVHDVTKYLKVGTVMLKHGRSGKPHNRLFWITSVSFRMELVWVDPENKSGERSSVNLNDVGYIALGSFSKVFKRHPTSHHDKDFFLSFTVGLRDGGRTVDMVASTLPDFEAWVLGLCHLARVDPHWGKPLDISGFPETSRLTPKEQGVCEQHYIFPGDYLKVKETVVKLRDEVCMHLRLFGNDQSQAFASLGGIHVPQLNDRGAMLMTKGELRYYCSPYNIDIFRVCKIWLLFHEMDLIYDPSFAPPTNFGITAR